MSLYTQDATLEMILEKKALFFSPEDEITINAEEILTYAFTLLETTLKRPCWSSRLILVLFKNVIHWSNSRPPDIDDITT